MKGAGMTRVASPPLCAPRASAPQRTLRAPALKASVRCVFLSGEVSLQIKHSSLRTDEDRVHAIIGFELREQLTDMGLDGFLGDTRRRGDPFVRWSGTDRP